MAAPPRPWPRVSPPRPTHHHAPRPPPPHPPHSCASHRHQGWHGHHVEQGRPSHAARTPAQGGDGRQAHAAGRAGALRGPGTASRELRMGTRWPHRVPPHARTQSKHPPAHAATPFTRHFIHLEGVRMRGLAQAPDVGCAGVRSALEWVNTLPPDVRASVMRHRWGPGGGGGGWGGVRVGGAGGVLVGYEGGGAGGLTGARAANLLAFNPAPHLPPPSPAPPQPRRGPGRGREGACAAGHRRGQPAGGAGQGPGRWGSRGPGLAERHGGCRQAHMQD
jgi:hypothetical protein